MLTAAEWPPSHSISTELTTIACYCLKIVNKGIKGNQEGKHNASSVSLNSYKFKCTIKQNIIIKIERKVKGDWWDASGLALIISMLASLQLDACEPPNTHWTCSA
jgi:hypothetical protein